MAHDTERLDGGTPRGDRAPLRPGSLVAKRWRVERFLAQGGMGAVYQVRDLELDVTVALKTIRADRADESSAERFRREILLARKVTHPNVCRIFDVGRDGEVTFLTMELIGGESLQRRIARRGPMTLDEARPMVRQIAAALEAAHAQEIVHRDLKSANVLVDGERAVVTDFGLAWAAAGDARLTGDGAIVGTPSTMAPEQVEGAPVSAATDVYALGVVMFEMATGTLPFVADSAMATAALRLAQNAPSPRARVPSIDPRWEYAILRCLEREPARRFARAREVVRALDEEPPRRRRWWIPVALAAAGVLALALWPRPSAPPEPLARRTIVVLPVRNLGPDRAELADALGRMLRAELGAGETLRALSTESTARLAIELALGDALPSRDQLAHVREESGATLIAAGHALVAGATLRLDVAIEDARGERIAEASASGAASDPPALAARVALALRARLGEPLPLDVLAALAHAANDPSGAPSPSLPREQRLSLEARAAAPARAAELWRTLRTFRPDELDYGLGLARALDAAGRSDEAARVRDELRRQPWPPVERARLRP